MLRRQAFKFRLEPKSAERRLLAQFAGCCRLVFNKGLALQKELLEAKKSCLSYGKLTDKLRCWKQEEDLFFLKECHSQPLQQTLKNLDRALKDAFDKSSPKRFPRFKKKGQRDSFRYPQGFKVDQVNSRVYLPKIGWVRYRQSQELVGQPKNITVDQRGQHWYVSIQTELEVEPPKPTATSIVGGDLGIARFLTALRARQSAALKDTAPHKGRRQEVKQVGEKHKFCPLSDVEGGFYHHELKTQTDKFSIQAPFTPNQVQAPFFRTDRSWEGFQDPSNFPPPAPCLSTPASH